MHETARMTDTTTRRTARVGYTANEYGLRSLGWKFDVLVPAAGESNDAYDALKNIPGVVENKGGRRVFHLDRIDQTFCRTRQRQCDFP
jgi:hypothetical protein